MLASPHSAAAEAYRTLRANLLLSSAGQPLKTLLVTSPATEAGKSLAVANLAVALAQGGRSTIVVDCDLRHPQQHELLGVPLAPGLAQLLADGAGQAAPAPVPSGVAGLAVLPAGAVPENPADLVTSRRMEALLAQLRGQADVVLVDAPPLIAVSDAALLAPQLDGVLLVLTAGQTRREHTQRAQGLLQRIGARLVGTVLVNAELDRSTSIY
jgi:non-specific protein-tyrosine kinase